MILHKVTIPHDALCTGLAGGRSLQRETTCRCEPLYPSPLRETRPVPGARPGQTVVVELEDTEEAPKRLTLANARTDEERDQIIAEILQAAERLRQGLSDEDVQIALNHGDYLYGEDGLPK